MFGFQGSGFVQVIFICVMFKEESTRWQTNNLICTYKTLLRSG